MNVLLKAHQDSIMTRGSVPRFTWLPALQEELARLGVKLGEAQGESLLPARLFELNSRDWGRAAQEAKHQGLRWAGLWVEKPGAAFIVTACFEKQGDHALFRTRVADLDPELPSHTPYFSAASRLERHAADLFGIVFTDHPDRRRWIRHQAWGEGQFPLRRDFPRAGTPVPLTPPDNGYHFIVAQGEGVYEIPVGPIHAGIIEPGHFHFLAVGETVLNLEERLGYVHKGIEKLGEDRDPAGLARLAGRVSGDSSVAHAWAACMAMERAARIEPPPRALILRAIFAERERIANHLGDIGAICNDVGFAFANYQFGRLRELWQRDNLAWFGHRLLMDLVVPGGVARDISNGFGFAMIKQISALRRELDELRPLLAENTSLQDRLVAAGVLRKETASALGCLGYVARASGMDFDLRRDAPYAPYDGLPVEAVCRGEGDVAARLEVRYDESYVSLGLLEQLLEALQDGEILAPWKTPPAGAEGLGLVEGWRGETLCFVRFGEEGRIARYFPRDPSVFNWSALEKLIHGNIVPDFPVCNKSVNGSYSGQDL
ncbi:MAG: NADH-quinone oxidoreductase subunit C [Methylococcaceae bacterium]|nr:NADH-quinone oxidoreductase subunit C [Methylococcaceae bacterium]